MLYTIVPVEQIWQGCMKEPSFFEINWQGRTLLVEQLDQTTVRIERLLKEIHIDDFLNTSFTPGQLLRIDNGQSNG